MSSSVVDQGTVKCPAIVDPCAGKVCEICGKPAEFLTADTVVQDVPKRVNDTHFMRQYHIEGGYRTRCKEHKHQQVDKDSPEYTKFMIDMERAVKARGMTE